MMRKKAHKRERYRDKYASRYFVIIAEVVEIFIFIEDPKKVHKSFVIMPHVSNK